MTDYVKVTRKEFLAMREAVESNAASAESGSDEDMKESMQALRATRAVEKRNGIEPPPYRQ